LYDKLQCTAQSPTLLQAANSHIFVPSLFGRVGLAIITTSVIFTSSFEVLQLV
jgi:hypothetical protein